MSKLDVLSLDGKLLRTFLTVFEEMSVTRAAARLGSSQSAVSHSLERLRTCIGDPLFIKKGRNIAATPVAATIAPKVSEILGALESLALQGDYVPDDDQSTFTIATNVTELLPLLMQIHRDLRKRKDNISLGFVELGTRTNAVSFLETGMADVAITVTMGAQPLELSVERFYQDEIVCFFDGKQRNAPTTLEEYCAARHATVDFGGDNKSLVDTALDATGNSRQVFLRASNVYALANLARGSDLIMTLPGRLAMTAFKGFSVAAPPFPLAPVSYDIMYHRRVAETARHMWFMDRLRMACTAIASEVSAQAR
ncbi:MAG: LysR family transcriptional regulator [Pseudomonadota bacterium]